MNRIHPTTSMVSAQANLWELRLYLTEKSDYRDTLSCHLTWVSVAKHRTAPGMVLAPEGGEIPVEMLTKQSDNK